MLVRKNNDLTQWIKFFLVAVIETAQSGSNTFRDVLSLREDIEGQRIIKLGRKLPLAKELLFYLYKKPVVTALDVEEDLKISKPTANAILKNFQQIGILKEQTGYKRNRIFIFEEYLRLFER
jgi:Fic family protein